MWTCVCAVPVTWDIKHKRSPSHGASILVAVVVGHREVTIPENEKKFGMGMHGR